ncbi:MAG: hypothetical protein IJ762_09300 [Bacteroidaceae bacterium]|nr:hypothetical protein [Bacteroidaceae bacterium]
MAIPIIDSAKVIEQQYRTGEAPILVMCSNMKAYVCKYMRSSSAAYKLVCELTGTLMAKAWQLDTPEISLVRIKPEHWSGLSSQHSLSAPAFGSLKLEGVVDITPSTYNEVESTTVIFRQLLEIALFDFWVANEDRNANNANLLYDVVHGNLVSIDYGCIFNTATFDYPMSQLTATDTIFCSDLFRHLSLSVNNKVEQMLDELKLSYAKNLKRCMPLRKQIVTDLPREWNVPTAVVFEKVDQLFDQSWIAGVWDNFMECLTENLE